VKYFDFVDEKGTFTYLTKASTVYSSNIEGNSIDLNSFMNYESSKEKLKTGKEIKETEKLISAYKLAQRSSLSKEKSLKSRPLARKMVFSRKTRETVLGNPLRRIL
jgi:hypothetical protein